MEKKFLGVVFSVVLGATLANAGQAKDVTIKSKVKNSVNAAIGKNNKAEQNVHSLDIGSGGEVGNVVIKGKVKNAVNAAIGKGNEANQNIGSVKVR